MNDDRRVNHWLDLAQEIGAEVSAEAAAPKEAVQPPAASPPPPATKKPRPKKPASSPPPKSHWQRLRGVLGLASPDEVVEKDTLAETPKDEPAAVLGDVPDGLPGPIADASPTAELPAGELPTGELPADTESPRGDPRTETTGRGGRRDTRERPRGGREGRRDRRGGRERGKHAEPSDAQALDTGQPLGREAWGKAAATDADVVSFEVRGTPRREPEPEKPVSEKAAPWGLPAPAETQREARVEPVAADGGETDGGKPDGGETDGGEQEQQERRPKRSRRRRGRGGRRRRDGDVASDAETTAGQRQAARRDAPASFTEDDEDGLELIDAAEPEWIEEEEVELPVPTRRSKSGSGDQQRRRREPSRGRDDKSSEASAAADDRGDDDDGDAESTRRAHRKIPSWQDAVGHIVSQNLENRKSDRGSGSGQRKRGRGGRGRRRGR